jgi:serine/threonine protein kinase
MACFKKLKCWKRAGNSKTGVIRSFLKCLLPCIRQKSRSPSPENSRNIEENKNLGNSEDTTHGRSEVEKSPHSGQFDDISFEETEQGHGRENKILENCKETTHGRTCAQYEALIQAERQQELIDIRQLIREVENSSHSAQFHGISFEETERDHGREEKGLCLEDFNILFHLGKGSFGQVVMAKKKSKGGHSSSEEAFALKLVPNKLECKVEKEILVRAVGHPFLVQLRAYFRTRESFCYVMEYCEGGSLHSLICRLKRFHVNLARFYAAEIILAVNFLHRCGIVHRDIKPGNILLDSDGHCKLADFGLSEVGIFKGMGTEGVFGTKGYRAPEIQRGCLYGPEVDWWSVGCVMFAMMVGKCRPEDHHPERYPLRLTKDAVSIINMFMETDPRRRLGARGDTRSILMHPFFKTVNWEAMLQKRVTPPVNPVTLEFLTEDLKAPGDNEESGSDISFETANEEPVLEGPPHKPQPVKCPTMDQGASGKMKKLAMVAAAVVSVIVSFVVLGNIL